MTDQFDNTFAIKEGWCISEVGSDTPFRLEKYDESTVFQSDLEVWQFVYDLAVRGSYYHNSALVYLNHNSPKEFRDIRDYYYHGEPE